MSCGDAIFFVENFRKRLGAETLIFRLEGNSYRGERNQFRDVPKSEISRKFPSGTF